MGTFTGGGFQPKGVAFAKEDGTGTGAVSTGRTKLEDRPDDIKKIKDIIAAEKTKTGESINF